MKIDSNIIDAPLLQVAPECRLMVCLCDLTEDDWIDGGALGPVQLCEKHPNTAKLQALIKSGVSCLLHVKNAGGEIVPLGIPSPAVVVECSNCNIVHRLLCAYDTFDNPVTSPRFCPSCSHGESLTVRTEAEWAEAVRSRMELLRSGRDWRTGDAAHPHYVANETALLMGSLVDPAEDNTMSCETTSVIDALAALEGVEADPANEIKDDLIEV